jgi:hypothetical protein
MLVAVTKFTAVFPNRAFPDTCLTPWPGFPTTYSKTSGVNLDSSMLSPTVAKQSQHAQASLWLHQSAGLAARTLTRSRAGLDLPTSAISATEQRNDVPVAINFQRLCGREVAHLAKLSAVACELAGGPQQRVQQRPQQAQEDGKWDQAYVQATLLTCAVNPAISRLSPTRSTLMSSEGGLQCIFQDPPHPFPPLSWNSGANGERRGLGYDPAGAR